MSSPKSAIRPSAIARDSDGSSTTPSGNPTRPSGIWRMVNATV